jgi:hypothetical protein
MDPDVLRDTLAALTNYKGLDWCQLYAVQLMADPPVLVKGRYLWVAPPIPGQLGENNEQYRMKFHMQYNRSYNARYNIDPYASSSSDDY